MGGIGDTHETVAAHLRRPARAPRILCGDLNAPRREHADGSLLTFAHDSNGRLRPERGERWDAAERALIRDLGWIDAFRTINRDARRGLVEKSLLVGDVFMYHDDAAGTDRWLVRSDGRAAEHDHFLRG